MFLPSELFAGWASVWYATIASKLSLKPDAGLGAVKGGCLHCLELVVFCRELNALRRRVKEFCDATATRRTP